MQSVCPILCQLRSADFVFVAKKKELAQRDGEGLFDKKARADIYVSYIDNINRKTHLGIVFVLFTLYTHISVSLHG